MKQRVRFQKIGTFSRCTLLLGLVVLTWSFAVFHRGVLLPPPRARLIERNGNAAIWIPKEKLGIHQLVLRGTPYERGLAMGRLTADLIYRQEKALAGELDAFFPSPLLRTAFFVGVIRWFWGIDREIEPWMLDEMYGVSKSGSSDFNYLMDPYTRQVAYHGLHEVGQWLVDRGTADFGCTVFAIPHAGSWLIGRNFDFEGGRIFDEEKVMKWVFPDEGHAFVSVTWSGMVGVTTGVNDRGVYVSLNAAGSSDYRRYGMPSTLLLLKALQFSSSAEEAARFLEKGSSLITDIYVVADATTAFRVEKSPKRARVVALSGPEVVTNHLRDGIWRGDRVNDYRMREMTTVDRFERGRELIATFNANAKGPLALEKQILSFLRDRSDVMGKALDLGNRKSIDALIATHSVIYNAAEKSLFVSRGPSVSGAFTGFDLEASFKAGRPVVKGELPADPLVPREVYVATKMALSDAAAARRLARKGRCSEAGALLRTVPEAYRGHADYYSALGDVENCRGDKTSARAAWRTAIEFSPAYPAEARALAKKGNG